MSGRYEGPLNPTHGLASTYRSQQYACRCQPCTKANAKLQKAEDGKRKARLEQDPTLAPHGSVSTYLNWGCRCEDCTRVHSEHCKAYYYRSKQKGSK